MNLIFKCKLKKKKKYKNEFKMVFFYSTINTKFIPYVCLTI